MLLREIDTIRDAGLYEVTSSRDGSRYLTLLGCMIRGLGNDHILAVGNFPRLSSARNEHVLNRCSVHNNSGGSARRVLRVGGELCLGYTGDFSRPGLHIGTVEEIRKIADEAIIYNDTLSLQNYRLPPIKRA